MTTVPIVLMSKPKTKPNLISYELQNMTMLIRLKVWVQAMELCSSQVQTLLYISSHRPNSSCIHLQVGFMSFYYNRSESKSIQHYDAFPKVALKFPCSLLWIQDRHLTCCL